MSGINTAGTPQTGDYVIGRGIAYFAPLSSGLPGPYRDLGNSPEFNITVDTETLKHITSRQGLAVTDKEVTISQDVTVNFQLDENSFDNLATFFAGTAAATALVNPTIAGVAATVVTTSAVLGRWYDLVSAAPPTLGVRCYDIETANLTLTEDPGGVPVVMVEGTDYTLDLEMGRVFLLSTAVNIVAGGTFDFVLAADAGAKPNIDEVKALTQTTVLGALKIITENPANNDAKVEWQFHQVTLKATGDLALIGNEFATMGITATAERNTTADPDSPTLTIRELAD